MNKNEKWKIKNILKNKRKWRKLYYFVRWKNFLLCENNWIFKYYLTNAQKLLKQYYKRKTLNIVVFKIKKLRLKIDKNDFLKNEWTTLLKHEYNVDYILFWLKIISISLNKEKKTLYYYLKNLYYCLKNLKSLMQFIFEFVCFLILFFKTSFAFLINLNRYFLRINIRFIHHISYHSRLVVDVALQYRCIYSKLKNEN